MGRSCGFLFHRWLFSIPDWRKTDWYRLVRKHHAFENWRHVLFSFSIDVRRCARIYIFAGAFALWIVMLVKSYRPIPRLRWVGWICFILLSLFLFRNNLSRNKSFRSSIQNANQFDVANDSGNIKRAMELRLAETTSPSKKYADRFSKPNVEILLFSTRLAFFIAALK